MGTPDKALTSSDYCCSTSKLSYVEITMTLQNVHMLLQSKSFILSETPKPKTLNPFTLNP